MRKCEKILFDTVDPKVKHEVYKSMMSDEIKAKRK